MSPKNIIEKVRLVHYLLQVRKVEGSWETVWHFQNHGFFPPNFLIAGEKENLACDPRRGQLHLSARVQNLWRAQELKNMEEMHKWGTTQIPVLCLYQQQRKKNKIYWPENWVIHYLLSYPHLSTEELSCAIHRLSRLPWRWHLDVVVTWMSKFILLGSCNVRESHWFVVWLGF